MAAMVQILEIISEGVLNIMASGQMQKKPSDNELFALLINPTHSIPLCTDHLFMIALVFVPLHILYSDFFHFVLG